MDINAENSDLYNGIYLMDVEGNLFEYSLYERKILTMKPLCKETQKWSKMVSSRPFKIEIGFDWENNVPMSAEFEWKMVYCLVNSNLKTIECYSSFRITPINSPNLTFLPGENPYIADPEEPERSIDEDIKDPEHWVAVKKQVRLIQTECFNFGQYQSEMMAFYEDGDIGFID